MKLLDTIKKMKWFILFVLGITGIKASADYMGYSLWPFQGNETSASGGNNARAGRTYFYHK